MKSRVLKLGLAAAALALALPAQTAMANTSSTTSSTVTLTPTQQRGLASLQREVDAIVARSGGRQTAVNEVTSPDGHAVLALPLPAGTDFLAGAAVGSVSGRTAARTASAAAATTGFRYGCPYSTTSAGGRWLCLYQNSAYNGNALASTGPGNGRLLKFQDAGYQALWPYDFQNRTTSVVNTTYFKWTIYDWFQGNPNCGAGDTPSEAIFSMSAASSGSYTKKDLNGTIYNDNSDCIYR